MGLFHFQPKEESIIRKLFLHLYAIFELPYVLINWLILRFAYPSRFWRRIFLPFIYVNVFLMLKWGQHGRVMTVKEVEEFLTSAEDMKIAIGSCRCRLGTPDICDCPLKTDITVKTGADVYTQHFSEDYDLLSKEEAIARIKEFNSEGLLPIAYSFCLCGGAEHVFVLCNCCIHACVPLLAQKIAKFHIIDPGRYVARVDEEQCVGCGTCVETCQVRARTLKEGKPHVNPLLCLGCGACARTCPEDATFMVERPEKVFKKQVGALRSFMPLSNR